MELKISGNIVQTENVVAVIEGSEKPNEYIVISSHLDHEGEKMELFTMELMIMVQVQLEYLKLQKLFKMLYYRVIDRSDQLSFYI